MNVRGVILTGASAAVHGVARRMKDAGIGDIIVVCGCVPSVLLLTQTVGGPPPLSWIQS